jgi:hypothetical protein
MKAASSHFKKMLALLERSPSHPGMEAMRLELQKSISAAELAVWNAQPLGIKRKCTVEVLSNLHREETEVEAALAKLKAQMEALCVRRDRVRKDIFDNQSALESIDAGILADSGQESAACDEWMDHDDGYYGWHNGWKDDYGRQQGQTGGWQDPYGGQQPAYTGQLGQLGDQSYLEQLQRLYSRLGSEATPESLRQAALLTNHFAEKVTELLAVASPAPVTPHQTRPLPTVPTPSPAAGSATLAAASPLPTRLPVVSVAAPTAAGRKVKDGKEKTKAVKPKGRDGKEKRVSLATSEEVCSSDSEEDMEDDAAAAGRSQGGEADAAPALGFCPAPGAAEAP